MISLSKHAPYRRFSNDRDKALERILRNHKVRVSESATRTFNILLRDIHQDYSMVHAQMLNTYAGQRMLTKIDSNVSTAFTHLAELIIREFKSLRKQTYLLSSASEAEALARVKKVHPKKIDKGLVQMVVNSDVTDAGSLGPRIYFSLNKLRRQILNAVELSKVMGENPSNMIERVKKVMPKVLKYKRAPRELKPLTEAETRLGKPATLGTDFMDDHEWTDIVNEYTDEYIPANRSGKGVFDLDVPGYGGDYTEQWYDWEIEQQLNQDFVDKVLEGRHDQAKEQGVTDFVWVSIIDDKTDDCCLWRDGLLISEIRDKLQDEHKDDECDADTPPAHFNCRCTMAPALEGTPEPEQVDYGDFEQWLNS